MVSETEKSEKPNRLPSTIGVVPYYPNLKLAFDRIASCLVFTYLEIHYPAPQDTQGRTSSLPVTVDVETVCRDLKMNRRTLRFALIPLCTLYREEAKRWSAARSAREFFNHRHSRLGKIKPFSCVTDNRSLDRTHTLTIRRNNPFIAKILADAAITRLSDMQLITQTLAPTQPDATSANKYPEITARRNDLGGLTESLAEILLRASALAGDRRKIRYPRLRKAVESGLEDASVLSAKQPKGRKRIKCINVGVEPELPEEVAARFNKLTKDEKQGI